MKRGPQTAVFAVIAGIAFGGWLAARALTASRARRDVECRALAEALDKTVRARATRWLEGIVEHRYDRAAGRCIAALEYHYKPCTPAARKKTPKACAGPDADIAIYAFRNGGALPLFICERTYATGEAACAESVFGVDGALLSSREIPTDQFPAIKAELVGAKP